MKKSGLSTADIYCFSEKFALYNTVFILSSILSRSDLFSSSLEILAVRVCWWHTNPGTSRGRERVQCVKTSIFFDPHQIIRTPDDVPTKDYSFDISYSLFLFLQTRWNQRLSAIHAFAFLEEYIKGICASLFFMSQGVRKINDYPICVRTIFISQQRP